VEQPVGLVGDVGGTHARFALAYAEGGGWRIEAAMVLPAADYPSGDDAMRAYLKGLDGPPPRLAVVAAAGPIEGGQVEFTNNVAWRFSQGGLTTVGGFAAVRLINDFTAQALAIEHLSAGDLRPIGPEFKSPPRGTVAIMGPGTGFGVAARVDDGISRAVLTCEGGHAGFSPGDDEEIEIVRRLGQRYGRVSVERVLSGPGLLNLYQTLAEMSGEAAAATQPDQVTRGALAGEPLCKRALQRFCAMLGSAAGDYALTYGAKGGVYISGGIAPDILDFLIASDFRRRFESKGRMSDYLRPIPTWVVVQPLAALIGAASLLTALETAP
jgi:glucokinase